jgi:tetratricopeptide (TPR) repeat protein
MKADLSERFKVLFIIFVSLGIYYPSIFGEENSVDDVRMITQILNTKDIDWKNIFLPESSLYYYRPVLWLSYVVDGLLFGCSTSIMHFENVLFHTFNGVLIYLITREILRIFKLEHDTNIPMFTSLFFIAHPINTEAVNWISGRTDLLAGFFVFIAFYIFLKSGIYNIFGSFIASMFYLLGLFSKEVAIGLLPVIIFFSLIRIVSFENKSVWGRFRKSIPFILITIIYFILRLHASNFSDTGIATVSKIQENTSFIIPLSGSIKAFGFYIKKLFIPIPLNFGIVEINRTLYFWFGIIFILILLYLFIFVRNLNSFLFFFAVSFFLPAIPVAISKMAWTPLAERYLYISSFAVSLLLILFFNKVITNKVMAFLIIFLIITGASIVTVNRNIIWQSNLTLYEDTIKKSPNFAPARNEYGIALAKKGYIEEARRQFEIAQNLTGDNKYKYLPVSNLAKLSTKNTSLEDQKERHIRLLLECKDPQTLRWLILEIIRINEEIILKEKDINKRKSLSKEIISYYKKLLEFEKNGFYYYRLGQYYMAVNDRKNAIESFKESVRLSPDQYFSEPARRLIKRLEEKK